MNIPEEIRKSVAFIGLKKIDGTYIMAGSAFFIGKRRDERTAEPVYVVTAKHVIDFIRNKGVTVVGVRLNNIDGEARWYTTPIDNWYSHPTDVSVDVSLTTIGLMGGIDHLVMPDTLCVRGNTLEKSEVGPGDEVFITGLFSHHYGRKRNIPIVRIGNLACLDEQKVITKDKMEIDAYLIEARSIGGLSGSPVFVNLGQIRNIGGKTRISTGKTINLLGIVHGHYDDFHDVLDYDGTSLDDNKNRNRVNTGIAIVIPISKVTELMQMFDDTKTVTWIGDAILE